MNDAERIADLIVSLGIARSALIRVIRRLQLECPHVWELHDAEGALKSMDYTLRKIGEPRSDILKTASPDIKCN